MDTTTLRQPPRWQPPSLSFVQKNIVAAQLYLCISPTMEGILGPRVAKGRGKTKSTVLQYAVCK